MKRYLPLMGLTLALCAFAPAQDTPGRVVVPARNSTRPRVVKVSSIQTAVTVKAYGGKEVIVESPQEAGRSSRRQETPPPGMHRIDMPRGGFSVEEDDNVITVHPSIMAHGPITISVPVDTSVQIKTVHGPITVEGVHGEVEASCTNGPIRLMNISGAITADTTNGGITASMDRVEASKPISFSSTNGTIDVTLPADLKANMKMRSFNGSIWSDFEMKLAGGQPVTTSGGPDARFRVRFDRTMYGTVNGGGVEASFSTLNGKIIIRKK